MIVIIVRFVIIILFCMFNPNAIISLFYVCIYITILEPEMHEI